MEHIRGRADGVRAEKRDSTFTGTVWGDPLMPAAQGVTMNTVYFAPGGRTHWHSHEGGQVLHVSSGEGWVARRGGPAVRVRAGDTVWTPPGEEHWHGAGHDALLVHVAVSLGKTDWHEEVEEAELASLGERQGGSSGAAHDGGR